jgi:hypothetical protein
MIETATVTIPDQWQVQIQARVQSRARVLVHADGLTDREIAAAHFEPVHDVSDALAGLLQEDPGARVCVLPEGPQTIAYVT